MKPFWRIAVLLLLSALCAAVQGLLVPRPDLTGESDPWGMDPRQALGLGEVLWVDGRPAEAYAAGHHPGAVHLTLEDWDAGLAVLLESWDPGAVIVVYCDGGGCESSKLAAARLREELGIESAYWLVGGWPALEEAAGL